MWVYEYHLGDPNCIIDHERKLGYSAAPVHTTAVQARVCSEREENGPVRQHVHVSGAEVRHHVWVIVGCGRCDDWLETMSGTTWVSGGDRTSTTSG